MNRSTLVATVRMLPRASLGLSAGLAALAVVQPVLGLAFMLAVGRFVGRIPELVAHGGEGLPASLALVIGIYLVQQVLGAAAEVMQWRLGQRLNHHLDDRVMSSMLDPSGIDHLEDATTRDLAAETADGLGAGRWRPARLPRALRAAVSSALALGLAFGVVIWLQWWLGLLLAAAGAWALFTVIRHSLGMIMEMVADKGEAEFRRLEYERDAAVGPASAKEVRLFGYGPWLLDRWQQRLMRVLALDQGKIARLDPGMVASVVALMVVVGGGFACVAVEAARGELGLAAATVLAQALVAPLAQVGPGGQAVIDLTLASRPVTALLKLETSMPLPATGPSTAVSSSPPPAPARPAALRLDGVGFSYPGSDVPVLREVDLDIPAGSSIAVVGLNGAGKTTLVKLLSRFYDSTAGRISANGTDIRAYEPSVWQRQVAAIFSDFARYPFNARDNVAVGELPASVDRVAAAADRAGATDVVNGLPEGWDTPLSREFTGGADLSGGQWQRLALARALLAADAGAGLLILDEPAASLDVRAEADLNERFLDLTQGITTIVISHRFSTVRRADRICVLEEGRITETGTHDQLLAADGRYASMFWMQAERFAV